ncbi:GNAT family N-acetyltransferase [Flavivirga rizhaonensis]|uniref:GNAT family N-acetyltransferase n=1 Tax=Flavivirga rizhaonensis TaxID=2559571 RepID=A0A4S1DU50_9FLAO|nr:GNAT family N-acetyltransferase [Flavivirga rizhaonensis]TGV01527.1 GNAT family N-acetyltransferase [Flavivirga rizhaonensis]
MLENESIKLLETKIENLTEIIEIEKKYSQFIGQYDITRHREVLTNKDEKHVSIFNKSNNILIGYVILAGLLNKDHVIEFRRIALLKRGLGYGSMAIKLIKAFCFKHYKAKKIWLDVFTDNEKAIILYKREGFVKENEIKAPHEGARSVYIMSITK